MDNQTSQGMKRRLFLSCFPALTLTGALLAQSEPTVQKSVPGKKLWDPLTKEEERMYSKSEMAASIMEIKGYSCAESIFLASLKYLKKPEKLVSVAGAFGGGLGHKDLCGLLTGGMMAIGLAAGMIHTDRKAFSRLKKQMVNRYWDWWFSFSPLRCSEIKPNCNRVNYPNMKRRVAFMIESLIRPAREV